MRTARQQRQSKARVCGLVSIVNSLCAMGLFTGFAYAYDYHAPLAVTVSLAVATFGAMCVSFLALLIGTCE